MEIADEIAQRQMQPDEDAAFFQQAKTMPLPMVIASEEFKRMPVEKKRRIMTMFDQQARDNRYNDTLEGTIDIGMLLSALIPAAGGAATAKMGYMGRPTTWGGVQRPLSRLAEAEKQLKMRSAAEQGGIKNLGSVKDLLAAFI